MHSELCLFSSESLAGRASDPWTNPPPCLTVSVESELETRQRHCALSILKESSRFLNEST